MRVKNILFWENLISLVYFHPFFCLINKLLFDQIYKKNKNLYNLHREKTTGLHEVEVNMPFICIWT